MVDTYTSKPQAVEAIQWTGENGQEVIDAFNGKATIETRGDGKWFCNILAGKDGAQQWVPVPIGHWIVHPVGDITDMWPIEEGYFQMKYKTTSRVE